MRELIAASRSGASVRSRCSGRQPLPEHEPVRQARRFAGREEMILSPPRPGRGLHAVGLHDEGGECLLQPPREVAHVGPVVPGLGRGGGHLKWRPEAQQGLLRNRVFAV